MGNNVLIVDDERDIHAILNISLRKKKFNTVNAYSIDEAKHLINEDGTPDFVLLDYNLPDGKGTDLIPILRRKFPSTKIAMITANRHDAEKSLHNEALKPDVFFEKPFSPEKIARDFLISR